MYKSARQTVGAIIQAKERDLSETEYFSGIQIKLWRALAIILAHHPELSKDAIRWMAVNCWLSGDKKILENAVPLWTEYAKQCGVALGVFEKDTVWSDDNGTVHRQPVKPCLGEKPSLNPYAYRERSK